MTPLQTRPLHRALLLGFFGFLLWSAFHPHDALTWFLETAPAMAGALLLVATYHRFRLTTLTYILIWFHAGILLIGGHYTYAEVPLFNWTRDTFHLVRNDYDRVGHFAQGFVPAIITREILLRTTPLRRGKMLFFLIVSVCLALSAAYEIVEFAVSISTGSAGDSFLATQGDVWDTQKDMLTALCAAPIALLTLGKLHDRFLREELSVKA